MKEYMNATSLKARIRNIAKEKNVSAQVILQNYFFECFLLRLSQSIYSENFIIKGGLLIASMAGLDVRSTMDMDVTIRSLSIETNNIENIINTICGIQIEDKITFEMKGITHIHEDNEYGGLRVSLEANYEKIKTPLLLDITTGDVITPKPVKRKFKTLLNNAKTYEIWTYNIETILAEKIETILSRSESNTRPRDFYDVYLITKTQKYNYETLKKAVIATSSYRGTVDIINNFIEILSIIKNSSILEKQWDRYRRQYSYAKEIKYQDVINALSDLLIKL